MENDKFWPGVIKSTFAIHKEKYYLISSLYASQSTTSSFVTSHELQLRYKGIYSQLHATLHQHDYSALYKTFTIYMYHISLHDN